MVQKKTHQSNVCFKAPRKDYHMSPNCTSFMKEDYKVLNKTKDNITDVRNDCVGKDANIQIEPCSLIIQQTTANLRNQGI